MTKDNAFKLICGLAQHLDFLRDQYARFQAHLKPLVDEETEIQSGGTFYCSVYSKAGEPDLKEATKGAFRTIIRLAEQALSPEGVKLSLSSEDWWEWRTTDLDPIAFWAALEAKLVATGDSVALRQAVDKIQRNIRELYPHREDVAEIRRVSGMSVLTCSGQRSSYSDRWYCDESLRKAIDGLAHVIALRGEGSSLLDFKTRICGHGWNEGRLALVVGGFGEVVIFKEKVEFRLNDDASAAVQVALAEVAAGEECAA